MTSKPAPSARGLFHATGKKSKPVNVRLEDGSYAKAPARERSEHDFDKTPPAAIQALIHHEGERLRQFPAIWDPSAGDGRIVNGLEAEGFTVIASDLIDRGAGYEVRDFYDFTEAPSMASVQNPPFGECSWGNGKVRWQKHALETLGLDYLALLLPWQWPGAAGLAGFWAEHRPARVYLMRWRLDFTGQGAQPALHAWYVFDKNWVGETVLRMMDPVDPGQGLLL